VTEWQLKSQSSKAGFLLIHVWSTLFYFGGGAGIVGAILTAEGIISTAAGFFAFVGCSVALGLLRLWFRLDRAIRASDLRMNDANYVATLRTLGLLK
jgi:hypothetical protein